MICIHTSISWWYDNYELNMNWYMMNSYVWILTYAFTIFVMILKSHMKSHYEFINDLMIINSYATFDGIWIQLWIDVYAENKLKVSLSRGQKFKSRPYRRRAAAGSQASEFAAAASHRAWVGVELKFNHLKSQALSHGQAVIAGVPQTRLSVSGLHIWYDVSPSAVI